MEKGRKKRGIQIKLSTKTNKGIATTEFLNDFLLCKFMFKQKSNEPNGMTEMEREATEGKLTGKTRAKIKYNVSFISKPKISPCNVARPRLSSKKKSSSGKYIYSYEFKSRFVIKTTTDRKMSTEKKRIIVGPFPEATT